MLQAASILAVPLLTAPFVTQSDFSSRHTVALPSALPASWMCCSQGIATNMVAWFRRDDRDRDRDRDDRGRDSRGGRQGGEGERTRYQEVSQRVSALRPC